MSWFSSQTREGGGINTESYLLYRIFPVSLCFLSINAESDLFPRIFPACLCYLSINTVIFIHQGFPSLPLLLEYQHRVRFTLQDFSSITLLPEHQHRVIFTVKDFFQPSSVFWVSIQSHIYSPGFFSASFCFPSVNTESYSFSRILTQFECHYRVIFISRILPASLCYLSISAESDLFYRNVCITLFLEYQYRVRFILQDSPSIPLFLEHLRWLRQSLKFSILSLYPQQKGGGNAPCLLHRLCSEPVEERSYAWGKACCNRRAGRTCEVCS